MLTQMKEDLFKLFRIERLDLELDRTGRKKGFFNNRWANYMFHHFTEKERQTIENDFQYGQKVIHRLPAKV